MLRDAALLPLGALQVATFGLAVIAGNWIVPLLEREGADSAVAGALGSFVLLAGIVTRPLGEHWQTGGPGGGECSSVGRWSPSRPARSCLRPAGRSASPRSGHWRSGSRPGFRSP